jgi:hypothetical protein
MENTDTCYLRSFLGAGHGLLHYYCRSHRCTLQPFQHPSLIAPEQARAHAMPDFGALRPERAESRVNAFQPLSAASLALRRLFFTHQHRASRRRCRHCRCRALYRITRRYGEPVVFRYSLAAPSTLFSSSPFPHRHTSSRRVLRFDCILI